MIQSTRLVNNRIHLIWFLFCITEKLKCHFISFFSMHTTLQIGRSAQKDFQPREGSYQIMQPIIEVHQNMFTRGSPTHLLTHLMLPNFIQLLPPGFSTLPLKNNKMKAGNFNPNQLPSWPATFCVCNIILAISSTILVSQRKFLVYNLLEILFVK